MMDPRVFFRKASSTLEANEAVMPLIGINLSRSETVVFGTAVMIGVGYAMTANHVIEDFEKHFQKFDDEFDSTFEIIAYLSLDKGARLLPLKVGPIWRQPPLDIAIFRLAIPENWPAQDMIWKQFEMSFSPPARGSKIVGYGFKNPKIVQNGDVTEIEIDPHLTGGVVLDVHEQIRDRFRLPFPCFHTNARFDGCMSGGPLLNEQGKLCGIICSNLPPSDPTEEHTSYGATLWPMLTTSIEYPDHPSYGMYEYFKTPDFPASDIDLFKFGKDGEGAYWIQRNGYRFPFRTPSVDDKELH